MIMWYQQDVKDRIRLLRHYKKGFPTMSYKDIVNDFNNTVKEYGNGGNVNNYKPQYKTLPSETTQMFNKPFIDPVKKASDLANAEKVKKQLVATEKKKIDDYYKNNPNLVGRKTPVTDAEKK